MSKDNKKKKSLKERLAAQRKALNEGGKGSYRYFIFKEGTTRMRTVPTGEENDWAVEVLWVYVSKDKGGFVSPATWGDKCAFMEKSLKLGKSSKDSDKDLSKKLKPKKKFLMPSIRYKDEKGKEVDTQAGVKLSVLTSGQYGDLIDLYMDDEEAGDFTHPKEGYDIKFTRTGKTQFDTEYSLRPCKPTELAKEYRKNTYDPIAMAKELTPSYEETLELLEDFAAFPSDNDSKDSGKKKKKKNRKDI